MIVEECQKRPRQTEVGRRTDTALRTVQNWEADVHSKDHSSMPHTKWLKLLDELSSRKANNHEG